MNTQPQTLNTERGLKLQNEDPGSKVTNISVLILVQKVPENNETSPSQLGPSAASTIGALELIFQYL